MAQDAINFVNFNQDFSCISVGSKHGYKIYNCDPFGKCFSKGEGGIGIVEMLFCTSLVAVVGMGDQPALSPRRLKIMNTKRQSVICELTFPTAVLKVMLNRRRLVVLLEEQIYIYDISNMKLLHTIETSPNPNAICSLSPSSTNCYLAYPSSAPQMSLNVPHAPPTTTTTPSRVGEVTIFDALQLQPVNVIEAHKSPLSVLSLNNDGTMLATASDKGTIIRIFAVPSGSKLYQFRRGTYPSKVFSINFNLTSSLLAVSSATETIHIFKLARQGDGDSAAGATTSGTRPLAAAVEDDDSSINDGIDRGDDGDHHHTGNNNSNIENSATSSSSSPPVMPKLSPPESGLDAYIDSKRNGVTNMLRRSSHTLGRHVAGAVGGYLPNAVAEMWEPKERDFAFIKLPAPPGTKSVVAISNLNQNALVVTGEGYFYQYAIDLEKGGECELIKQYSLDDDLSSF